MNLSTPVQLASAEYSKLPSAFSVNDDECSGEDTKIYSKGSDSTSVAINCPFNVSVLSNECSDNTVRGLSLTASTVINTVAISLTLPSES